MEESNFSQEIQAALRKKKEWFNTVSLNELVDEYRLLNTCFHNIYDTMTKKNIIIPDPYRLDKRINDIFIPEKGPFSESDVAKVMGTRLSDYDVMLDYLCTYFRFTVDSIQIPTLKKLVELNKTFDWDNFSTNSANPNTRGFTALISTAKVGAPNVIQSMINDAVDKCIKSGCNINKILGELELYLREDYKSEIRSKVIGNPDFNREKAMSSADMEMAEIKRLFPKVIGKKTFYNDLVCEIIAEDQAADKEKLRNDVLKRLEIKEKRKNDEKRRAEPSSKELLMATVAALGAMAPTLAQLHGKLDENFKLLYTKKKSFFTQFCQLFKKAFHIKDKEKICNLVIKDSKTGQEKVHKLNVMEFMNILDRKVHVYNGIGSKGQEYQKISSASEEAILAFVNKQISEVQSDFTIINALDAHFKKNVDVFSRIKVRGMQIELSSLRNSIINANKKRGEYVNFKEEVEQMKKLGINSNA